MKRILLMLLLMVLSAGTAGASGGDRLWSSGGHDLENTRNQPTETKIDPSNAADLALKWTFSTGGDVSATPAVDGKAVFVPDWAGNLWKLDRRSGAEIWSRQISDFTGITGDFSRTTPAVYDGLLIIGDQGGRFDKGAQVMAVSKKTGDLLWATQVDTHPAAVITQSPVVFDNVVYVGVSSVEELFAVDPNYPCCTFRGSVVALDVNTGQILWVTYLAPSVAGYSGNGVWGGTPVVDPKRGSVYVTTGNNYTVPADVLTCVAANEGDTAAILACLNPDNYFDSVVALNRMTGEIKWATRTIPFDAWNGGCLSVPNTNCPSPTGPGFDFGEGATLFTTRIGNGPRTDLLGAGQKSGQYWVLDPDNGQTIWVTQSGPGGVFGGLIWGSAVDGERIYTANANSESQLWTLIGGNTTNSGFWSALDTATGEILWQTPNPASAPAMGPVTSANGVVYGCSLDTSGHMYAMDAATGTVLWSFASGGSCNSGAAVVNGTVYWGSGNNLFFAFEVPK
jgi:polyvinyl alcohol dehydrogenase (cytochrome)